MVSGHDAYAGAPPEEEDWGVKDTNGPEDEAGRVSVAGGDEDLAAGECVVHGMGDVAVRCRRWWSLEGSTNELSCC